MAEVDRDTTGVEHDPAQPADQHRRGQITDRDRGAVEKLTPPGLRIDRRGVDLTGHSSGERCFDGGEVGHDVHVDVRCFAVDWGGGGGVEDCVQGVEASLRSGSSQVADVDWPVGDVLSCVVDIGAVLGVDEVREDLLQQFALCQPAAGVEVELVTDTGERGHPVVVGVLGALVGSVEVGESFPHLQGSTDCVVIGGGGQFGDPLVGGDERVGDSRVGVDGADHT